MILTINRYSKESSHDISSWYRTPLIEKCEVQLWKRTEAVKKTTSEKLYCKNINSFEKVAPLKK